MYCHALFNFAIKAIIAIELVGRKRKYTGLNKKKTLVFKNSLSAKSGFNYLICLTLRQLRGINASMSSPGPTLAEPDCTDAG